MFEALGFFAIGLVLLALGGDSIVKGASGVAQRLGASPFVAGLLLVAFGTSLPELAVNARAMWTGAQQLALGNAVGSNVANIGLTLGLAALATPLLVRSRAIVPLLAWLIGTTLVVIAMGFDGVLVRSEGAILLLGFAGMLFFLLKRARNEPEELRTTIAAYATTRADLAMNLLRLGIAIALLYFGAKFVVQSAPLLGVSMGLSPLLTGLLPVAIGTALPEIAAAIAAARRGQGDMVAGHVIGSSLFNLLVVLGGMAVFRDLPVPASFVRFELPAALAFALVLYPMLRSELQVSKREGGVLVIAFLGWLVFQMYTVR
ncbi:MAG: calcium/sodium antiporter [Pseudomonadota bacterium]|nr:calcium/sodium antiporter [Pseudomonadota bacterium]MDQ3228569.1 calcium/sodium antiporter [Pseudomonadota bacterium]